MHVWCPNLRGYLMHGYNGLKPLKLLLDQLTTCFHYTSPVAGSITLTSSTYDAFESEEEVSVCAVIMVEALEREIVVHLSSQDLTARSM